MSNIFSVQKLQNVFVTNNSVIIDQGLVRKDSCVSEANYNKYKKFGFKLKYFFPLFSFEQKPHILITDEWSKNYCHWLWEALSKLIEIKKEFPESILILPESYLKIEFMMKSLEAFGFNKNNIKTISKKSKLKVKNLATINCINISTPGYYDFLKFEETAQALIAFHKEKLKLNFGERIYISRSDPKKNTARKVANEVELVAMLTKHGFKTVYMENFSFLEQVSIMNSAKVIIAPHGAGITNVMFAGKKSRLLEMVSQKWGKTCFAEMCEKMTIPYHRFDCVEADENKVAELRDIKVDVALLEQELIQFLR